MHYSNYSARCAQETRQYWNTTWDAMVQGKRRFVMPLHLIEKTIYCVKGFNNSPYTVTDRTSGMIINCQTIEDARTAFGQIQSKMLANGWEVAA